jgi:hypothetical protein
MTLLRRVWLDLLILDIGICAGVAWGVHTYQNTPPRSLFDFLYQTPWHSAAGRTLIDEEPEVARWALVTLIEMKEKELSEMAPDAETREARGWDLIWAHCRLAVVYRALGDEKAYRETISRTLEFAKRYPHPKTGLETEDDVWRLAKKITRVGPKIADKVPGLEPVSPKTILPDEI